jgi:L-cysteine desulfidase
MYSLVSSFVVGCATCVCDIGSLRCAMKVSPTVSSSYVTYPIVISTVFFVNLKDVLDHLLLL